MYSSYTTTTSKRESVRAALTDAEYWIGTFRSPLDHSVSICFAAVLYSNGTIEKAHPRNCSDTLPSLCLQNDVTETVVTEVTTTTGINDVTKTEATVTATTTTNNPYEETTTEINYANAETDHIILWCILGLLLILCVLISIMIFLFIRERANRSQCTRQKRFNETSTELVQHAAYALTPRIPTSDGNTTNANVPQAEDYEEVDDICHASRQENTIHHEPQDEPSTRPTNGARNYEHLVLYGNTEKHEYHVVCS